MTDDLLNKRSQCTQIMKIILITLHVGYLALFGFLPALQAEPAGISSLAAIPPPTSTQAQTNWAALSNVTPTNSLDEFFGYSEISGKVTGPDGITPLNGVPVYTYRLNSINEWRWVGSAWTTADGSYVCNYLPAGIHRIKFGSESFGAYVPEFYNNSVNIESAVNTVLGANSTVLDINASLLEKGKITGVVTAMDGVTPLSNLQVKAYELGSFGFWLSVASTLTNKDGSYTLEGLNPGTYRVGFLNNYYGVASVIEEYYNNVSKVESAADIEVIGNRAVNGINASLIEKGKITGVVTGPDGITPLNDIYVYPFKTESDGRSYQLGPVLTSIDGSYSIRGLNEGNYKILFKDYNQKKYAFKYYNNSQTIESSKSIFVGANAVVDSINTILSERGKITGRIVDKNGIPLGDVNVSAFYRLPSFGYQSNADSSVRTQADGNYSLDGLESGYCRIKFSNETESNYSVEYYNRKTNLADAEDILISNDQTVAGINAVLTETGKITGKVTGPDGLAPLKSICVEALCKQQDGSWSRGGFAKTTADGSFAVRRLVAGTYQIRFFDFEQKLYLDKYYDNVGASGLAKEIVLAENEAIFGVDASLVEMAKITGKVTGPDGITPLDGVWVEVGILKNGEWSQCDATTTQTNGDFAFLGLKKGIYTVQFFDVKRGYYDRHVYNHGTDVNSPKNIYLEEGEASTGINVSLTRLRSEVQVTLNRKRLERRATVTFVIPKGGPTTITKYVTIKNIGKAQLKWLKANKRKDRFSNFLITPLTKTTLPIGGSLKLKVTFKSSGAVTSDCLLFITSNEDGDSYVIKLVGKKSGTKRKQVLVSSFPANSLMKSISSAPAHQTMVITEFKGESKFNTLTVFKSPPLRASIGVVEVSSNLVDWCSGSNFTTTIEDNVEYCKVRDNIPFSKERKRFIRLKDQAR